MLIPGRIRIFGCHFAPIGWARCDGSLLKISDYRQLFQLIGTTYGGDGQPSFALPDLRGRTAVHNLAQMKTKGGEEKVALTSGEMPAHTHQVNGSGKTADLRARQTICGRAEAVRFLFPPRPSSIMSSEAVGFAGESLGHENMSPYLVLNFGACRLGILNGRPGTLGEIVMMAGDYKDDLSKDWMACEGQILSLQQNHTLFGILGNTFGGNGKTTFQLPDMRGLVAVQFGQGKDL